jgi:hypothetical protein
MIFQAHQVSRLYYVTTLGRTTVDDIKEACDRKKKASLVSLATWHSRLGHLHLDAMKKLKVLDELSTNLSERESECLGNSDFSWSLRNTDQIWAVV